MAMPSLATTVAVNTLPPWQLDQVRHADRGGPGQGRLYAHRRTAALYGNRNAGRVAIYCSASFSAKGWNAVEPAAVIAMRDCPQPTMLAITAAPSQGSSIVT